MLQVLTVTLAPGVDPVVVATVIGAVTGFLGVAIAFIAQTSTTPISDPQLKSGTMVRIVDPTDGKTVIDHAPIYAAGDANAPRAGG